MHSIAGLIYLDESYVMRLNRERELLLTTLKLDGGLEDFRRYLDKPIYLPPDRHQWPDVRIIRKANRYRQIREPNA